MPILQATNLPAAAHGFFGRDGGVSQGIFASLNCGPGSGDDLADIHDNRERVRLLLAAAHLVTLYQMHSDDAVIVNAPWEMGRARMPTRWRRRRRGHALGILTADCAPVLFADAQAGVDRGGACGMERRVHRRDRIRAAENGRAGRGPRA